MALAIKVPDRARMSVDEFLAWDSGNDLRYELVDGHPVAQSAPSSDHGIIGSNIIMALGNRFRAAGRPCLVENGACLRINTKASVRVPDLLVRCGSRQSGQGQATLAVEVLSPSNSADEMADKRDDYALCGIREVLEVRQDRAAVRLFRFDGDARWQLINIIGLDSVVELGSVGLSVPMAEIYLAVIPKEDPLDATADA